MLLTYTASGIPETAEYQPGDTGHGGQMMRANCQQNWYYE
jgi:hypothetical protein